MEAPRRRMMWQRLAATVPIATSPSSCGNRIRVAGFEGFRGGTGMAVVREDEEETDARKEGPEPQLDLPNILGAAVQEGQRPMNPNKALWEKGTSRASRRPCERAERLSSPESASPRD